MMYTKPYILTNTKLPKYFSYLHGTSGYDQSTVRTRNKTELHICHKMAKIIPFNAPFNCCVLLDNSGQI